MSDRPEIRVSRSRDGRSVVIEGQTADEAYIVAEMALREALRLGQEPWLIERLKAIKSGALDPKPAPRLPPEESEATP